MNFENDKPFANATYGQWMYGIVMNGLLTVSSKDLNLNHLDNETNRDRVVEITWKLVQKMLNKVK